MNITFLRNSNVFPKASRWFIQLSVVYLLIWHYGMYSLFDPYFYGDPFPWREYTKVMTILFIFHVPVLLATLSKMQKYRWILLIPILAMICLYGLLISKMTIFDCSFGIIVHLLGLYILFKPNRLKEGRI